VHATQGAALMSTARLILDLVISDSVVVIVAFFVLITSSHRWKITSVGLDRSKAIETRWALWHWSIAQVGSFRMFICLVKLWDFMMQRLFDWQVVLVIWIILLSFIVILIALYLRVRKHKINFVKRCGHCHSIYIGDFNALVQNCLWVILSFLHHVVLVRSRADTRSVLTETRNGHAVTRAFKVNSLYIMFIWFMVAAMLFRGFHVVAKPSTGHWILADLDAEVSDFFHLSRLNRAMPILHRWAQFVQCLVDLCVRKTTSDVFIILLFFTGEAGFSWDLYVVLGFLPTTNLLLCWFSDFEYINYVCLLLLLFCLKV